MGYLDYLVISCIPALHCISPIHQMEKGVVDPIADCIVTVKKYGSPFLSPKSQTEGLRLAVDTLFQVILYHQ